MRLSLRVSVNMGTVPVRQVAQSIPQLGVEASIVHLQNTPPLFTTGIAVGPFKTRIARVQKLLPHPSLSLAKKNFGNLAEMFLRNSTFPLLRGHCLEEHKTSYFSSHVFNTKGHAHKAARVMNRAFLCPTLHSSG